jgi:hypothetical protein
MAAVLPALMQLRQHPSPQTPPPPQVLGCCMLPLSALRHATPIKLFERLNERRPSGAGEQPAGQQAKQPPGGEKDSAGGQVDQRQAPDLCWALVQEFLEVGSLGRGSRRPGGACCYPARAALIRRAVAAHAPSCARALLQEGTLYSAVALQWQNPQLSLYSSEAALDWMLGLARAVQHLHAASPQVRVAAASGEA